jgi:drug/metabolite transporter (DMT)-like permease
MNRSKVTEFFKTLLLPLLPMALWGSLFPMIKVGYSTLSIDSGSIPDILMFAAIRFTVCGAVICIISMGRKERIGSPLGKHVGLILLTGLFSIVLHYAFTYIGLTLTDSSKTAILKQLGVLFYICFAFIFIKSEKFSIFKIIGAAVGFGGILAINIGSGGISFSLGDILIILASVCTVISSILSALVVKDNSPFWVVGISQLGGGAVILIAAIAMGGKMPTFSLPGTLSFLYICVASIAAYLIWTYLMRTVSLSRLFIIKFAEPLFACLFGAILLGEDILKWQYLLAFILISGGIILGNREQGRKKQAEEHEVSEKAEAK